MPLISISPEALANARAVVLDPASVRCHPAVIGGAWATLKAARGQTVDQSRLTPAYLIEPAAQPPTAHGAPTPAASSQPNARTITRIREAIARRHLRQEGGAA